MREALDTESRARLAKDRPAERGSIKVGDVVTEYDGQEIKAAGDFPIMVARTPVQKKVEVKVLRERSGFVSR